MRADQLERLRTHSEQLALSLIREANPDGVIRTPNSDGTAGPDVPATHHLIEVMAALDAEVFADGMSAAVRWLMTPENGVADHPFALDSFALVGPPSAEQHAALQLGIARHQLKDGSIPVFTAHLPGGDYFSTLWSVKVLMRCPGDAFASEISRALDYLKLRRDVGCTKASQLGFLGLLLAKLQPGETASLHEVAQRLLKFLDSEGDAGVALLTDRLFLLEDLLAIDRVIGGLSEEIDRHLIGIYLLDEEATAIPEPIDRTRSTYSASLFLETIARCAIVGIQRCELNGDGDIALSVNRLIHSDYRNTRYKALQTSAGLRAFLERYGAIHEAFVGYNEKLEQAWVAHAFNKTIFLMMPFRADIRFRKLTEVIKLACKKHGYAAIRVDDVLRRFSDKLWDNLIINMLASKYAIAVHVSEPVVDRLKSDEMRLFANPNVALEFGFFKSRGQEVLILKDKSSTLPSDLQGHLWSEFDIDNPDTTVPHQVEMWLERIKESSSAEGGS